MSADNWAICPKCTLHVFRENQKKFAKVTEMYGIVSLEEYEAALIEFRKPVEAINTLREDFHFHLDVDGDFSAAYYATCITCGFSYNFEHVEQIKITED